MGRFHLEHGPDSVRREIERWGEGKVPRHWIRLAMAGCRKCAQWKADRARVSAMHRAYRRRTR